MALREIEHAAAGVHADVVLAGVLLIGYLVGNRGFAQLSVPKLPLLVGELTLGIGLVAAGWRAACTKSLPVRRVAFGCARLRFDVRDHGAVALRDFALLYYALFFFLAQGWAAEPAQRRWLERCLTVAFTVAPPVFVAFTFWPDFFMTNFTFVGVPLVFIKADVEGGLLVAGIFWCLQRHTTSTHSWWLVPATANLVAVAACSSRAALVALVAACAWPLVCREWRLVRPLAAIVAVGLSSLALQAVVTNRPLVATPIYRLIENVASVTDTQGTRVYLANNLDDKPDNNQFRLVWWRAVVDEVWTEHRWLGLGFGHDLAAEFLRIYYADANEDFSARSPHNFSVTVFGRMGLVGLGFLLALTVALGGLLWRAGRQTARGESDGERFTLGLGAWAILVSACFGVVLEGPMGATVFWTLLGLANATDPDAVHEPEPLVTAEPAPIEAAGAP